jgi:hypothetical protein
MNVIKTPGSVNAQNGSKGEGMKRGTARSGGSNQGKVTGLVHRYAAHPRKSGQ